jgi:DDE superfamily endonuclease
MGNLSSHKARGVREAIQAAGYDMWYLPPYPRGSPDYNPIEKLWHKAKSWLRRVSAEMFKTLSAAVAAAFRAVAADECANYLATCGYGDC